MNHCKRCKIETENKTGRVIAHCGDVNDAIMMISFDPENRSYSRHRFLMDQVIDVLSTTDKQLPGQIGLPEGKVPVLDFHKERLPQGEQNPVIV